MNERVPDSSRLPLRATVMVLLFLGVIFLLMGFQAMGSGDDEESITTITTATTTTTRPSPPPAEPKAHVLLFNTNEDHAVGDRTAERLTSEGFKVTETRHQPLSGVTETTVFFGDAPGEREAADELGQLLQAPVEPRGSGFVNEPPGIIVAVTG